MTLGISRPTLGLVGLLALTAACEPAGIVEARNQLGRGGERSIVFALPLIDTVFKIQTLLDSSTIDTTAADLLAVVIDPKSLSVGFGEELVFEGINLDTLAVTVPSAELAVPGTAIPFSETYDALDSDTILDDVDTVLVQSGVLSVTTRSKLPIPVTYTATLDGFFQAGGVSLVGGGTVPAAAGNGSYRSDTLTFNLAGVSIVPAAVSVAVSGTATVGGTPIPAGLGDSAIVQYGGITTLQVAAVSGTLDPSLTPELNVSVEEVEEIPEADLDLGDLEDAIKDSRINDATISLTLGNGSGIAVALSDFNLGVVTLDVAGNVPRDVSGDPVFEVDTLGNPLLVAVRDSGLTTLTLSAMETTNLELNAAPLLDRLVHLLLDDERAAIVAAGNAAVGDSSQARVTSTDSVSVAMGMTLGLDFTIPATGVTFSRNTTGDGLELDSAEADQLLDRIDSVVVTTDVVNQTPFGVEIDIAFAEGVFGDDVDVDTLPNAVVLGTITLDAPTVDGQGLVTTSNPSTVSIYLRGTQARQLMEGEFTATLGARLLPGAGGSGRGAIRATDEIVVVSRVSVYLWAGTGQ